MESWLDGEIDVLDGGFGTTLEDVFGKDISGPLWSAKLIDEEPDTIVTVHSAFLNVGSNVILTSTYQCAFETFERAGYSRDDAIRLMRKAVRLAAQAKEECEDDKELVRIVLSLGPYGATLSPAQEFDGIYPPLYGPMAYTTEGKNTNAFKKGTDEGWAAEHDSMEALANFHYERLKVFADNVEDGVWSLIDAIAFETVPLSREIFAIRMAMARLKTYLESQGLDYKPWWISTVWPLGVHPEEAAPGGPRLPAEYVALALTLDRPLPNKDGRLTTNELAVPDGIGINCTHIADLDEVVKELRKAIAEIDAAVPRKKVFLALYPNGGNVYDIVNHRWISEEERIKVKMPVESWAQMLAAIALIEMKSEVWRGVLVGGCCKTTPKHIELLREFLEALNSPQVKR